MTTPKLRGSTISISVFFLTGSLTERSAATRSFFSDEFFKPYVGTITIAGISVAAKDIPGALGEAYWVDTDEDEKTHFYKFGTHEILCMFALDGSINEIVLTTFPVLADPVQRERYGVTKAWP